MEEKNFTYIVTFKQRGDRLAKVFTHLKAQEPEVQQEIDTNAKFKLDMGLSIAGAGIAAMLLATHRLGGHSPEVNMTQLINLIQHYLNHGGPIFSPDQRDLFG